MNNKKSFFSWFKYSSGDRIFTIFVYFIITVLFLVSFYPVYYVLIASFSDYVAANSGNMLLIPSGFHLVGYTGILQLQKIWIGYGNTLIYVLFGTIFGLACSMMAGYGLSRKDLPARNIIMLLMIFTMFFSGGMIPTYITVKNFGLLNTRLVLIIMGSVSVYNIILIRTFFSVSIPNELREATVIDGCGNFRFFIQFALPLSTAIVAVITLYIAIYHWNAYFNALLYITDRNKLPLQVILRELLTSRLNEPSANTEMNEDSMIMLQVIKYSVIVVSIAPIMCLYPFVQKYFIKGVMIGSIKG
ncbi:MAG: carbohydrate ABC transporter permease [Treponema sp.]|nr:carbohydrate ABC transporter permease [Treponema sp.]